MFEMLYDQAEVGKRIKAKRKEFKMTQQELAERLSVSSDSISDYERGETQCGSDNLVKLCQIFNVSADYFLFGFDKKLKEKNWNILNQYTEEELELLIKAIKVIRHQT